MGDWELVLDKLLENTVKMLTIVSLIIKIWRDLNEK